MDGLARGLCVSEHLDGETAVKALGAYVDDAWMHGLSDSCRALDAPDDSTPEPASNGNASHGVSVPAVGRASARRMLDVALKAVDTIGRAAMREKGMEAVLKWSKMERLVLGLAGLMAELKAEQIEGAVLTLLASSEVWSVVIRQGVWDEMVWAVRRGLVGTGRGRSGAEAEGSEDAGEALLGLLGCRDAAERLEKQPCLARSALDASA